MRFGVLVPSGWTLDLVDVPVDEQWGTILDVTRTAEAAGFDSAWVVDHFHTTPEPAQESTYEAWSLTAALAGATNTIRLGQMATCNSYRSPAYLAHVAASVDVISGGRLEFGLGAGWYEQEYLAHGYPFPRPSVRIGQVAESIQILMRMWTQDEASFEGEHYQIQDAICMPKPLQKPHPPIWVAGGGEKLTLRVAAKYASSTNFGDSPEEFAHKSQVLRDHCSEIGRDFDRITRSTSFVLVCAATEAEAFERFDETVERRRRVTRDHQLLERYTAEARDLSGPPDKIIDRLRPYLAHGLDYLLVRFPDAAYDQAGMELFARDVVGSMAS